MPQRSNFTLSKCNQLVAPLQDQHAVAIDAKPRARRLLADTLQALDYGARAKLVRINDLCTDWGAADLDVIAAARPEAILLPKVDSAADIENLARKLDARAETADTRIWAMMESPLGILNALDIAGAPRMAGFVMGTNDLAKDMGLRYRADRMPLLASLQMGLLAAKARGLVAVDGVYNAFRDGAGLRAECDQGRDMGFDGKTLIHPSQLEIANRVFAPSSDEIDTARRQISAYEEALKRGEGVAVLDGKIVENLHILTAKQILAKAEALAS